MSKVNISINKKQFETLLFAANVIKDEWKLGADPEVSKEAMMLYHDFMNIICQVPNSLIEKWDKEELS